MKPIHGLLALALLALFASPARADGASSDTFTLTYGSGASWAFSLPGTLTPTVDQDPFYDVDHVPVTVTGENLPSNLLMYDLVFTADSSGNLPNLITLCEPGNNVGTSDICDANNKMGFGTSPITFLNGQMTFIPGVYQSASGATFTITAPEPASFALLAVGIMAIACLKLKAA
jgi:hypothetical protein